MPSKSRNSGFDFDESARVLGEAADLLRELHMQGAELGYPSTNLYQRKFVACAWYLDTVALSLLAVQKSGVA